LKYIAELGNCSWCVCILVKLFHSLWTKIYFCENIAGWFSSFSWACV